MDHTTTNDTQRRGGLAPIFWFIGLTFAATFALEITLIHSGIRFDTEIVRFTPTPLLFATMWIPGLAALFVTKVIEGASWKDVAPALSIRMGSAGPYFLTLIIAPLILGIIYGASWALGLTAPDLTMHTLNEATGRQELFTPEIIFKIMLPMSAIIGPFIHFFFSLGEELGWRGFLLPRLMVFGKARAYVLLGVIWGLWHAPLIWVGFNYPGHPVSGIAMMCVLCTAFGLFLNAMTLHYRSVLLAAFIHGAINAQGDGIWVWLFPGTDPLLGGGTGLIAVVIWVLAGSLCQLALNRLRRNGIS